MEKKIEKKDTNNWSQTAYFLLFLLFFIPLIFKGINSCNRERVLKKEVNSYKELPHSYKKTFKLEKGKVIRIEIPIGYSCEYSDPGYSYFKQPEGHEKILVGGGLPYYHQSSNSSWVEFSVNKVEVTISCYFKKTRR